MNMIPVESSHIKAIGYDEETQVMRVEYSQATYEYRGIYAGIPKEVYDKIMSADSKGRALKEAIAEHGLQYKRLED
jgi:hypothetical protein